MVFSRCLLNEFLKIKAMDPVGYFPYPQSLLYLCVLRPSINDINGSEHILLSNQSGSQK